MTGLTELCEVVDVLSGVDTPAPVHARESTIDRDGPPAAAITPPTVLPRVGDHDRFGQTLSECGRSLRRGST